MYILTYNNGSVYTQFIFKRFQPHLYNIHIYVDLNSITN